MPAGVSWPRYIAASSAALFSMMLGSQTVHSIYRPMKNFDQLVEEEKEKMRKEAQKLNQANLQENRREISNGSELGGDNFETKNSGGDNSSLDESSKINVTELVLDKNANEEKKKTSTKECENVTNVSDTGQDKT